MIDNIFFRFALKNFYKKELHLLPVAIRRKEEDKRSKCNSTLIVY